ncbi:hypothetical protein ACFQ2S_17700 [Tropicimonas aquimaris]|uniref:Uncharacterized protein n=2 Tax=Tropicimonas aquimaris TaxID=914152 RepID=A0ABW3IUL8_9RHOB
MHGERRHDRRTGPSKVGAFAQVRCQETRKDQRRKRYGERHGHRTDNHTANEQPKGAGKGLHFVVSGLARAFLEKSRRSIHCSLETSRKILTEDRQVLK